MQLNMESVIHRCLYPNYTNKCAPLTSETWNSGRIIIHSVCPSSDGSCKIIIVSYVLKMTFSAKYSKYAHVEIPNQNGEIVESNSKNFIPLYPVFKD